MPQPELDSPTPAKQAQVKALGHVAALREVVKELPAGSRSPEDEAYVRELYEEGKQLHEAAADLQPAPRPVHVEAKSWTLTTPEEHRELVAVGEIKPNSGPSH